MHAAGATSDVRRRSSIGRGILSALCASGAHRVRVNFTIDGVGLRRGGEIELLVDGSPAGKARLERTVPYKFAPEGGTVGHDTATPLVDD